MTRSDPGALRQPARGNARWWNGRAPGNSFAALAFDVDDGVALERLACANMSASEIPVPNVAIYGGATDHAHAVYALARPVHRGECARVVPLETLGRAPQWLCEAPQADAGYAGVLVANPIHRDYRTAWLRLPAYSLAERRAGGEPRRVT